MFALIVIVPLIIASFIMLFLRDRERYAGPIAFGASLLSSLLIWLLYAGSFNVVQKFTWFSFAGFNFHIAVETLPLNMVLLALIGIITPLIMLYSLGYISTPDEKPRYYFEMSIFAAAMMVFAVSANFITMFIAWEMLGITSYVLIGFWYQKDKAPTAARKAITTIIIGDIAMLSAILLIWSSYGTFSFNSILASPLSPILPVALVLILVAAFTKSAQFPFHEWLADAMEGPTPVSAFLHSSTMVKAGVFLVIVLFPLYYKAGLLYLILGIGAISAILGASNAISSHHIKRILAYSTIEDLGLMFVAIGLNAILAAVLFFIVQAFYKALLFMSAGSIMRANDEKEDIYSIYGSKYNKVLYASMLIGVLSIAGIFPLSGFFGKVAIDTSASSNILVYIILIVIDFATSAYIFRWLFIHSREAPKALIEESKKSYKQIPKSMLYSGAITAVLVIAAGISFLYVSPFLSQYNYSHALNLSVTDAVIETVIVAFGLFVSYRLFSVARPTGEIKSRLYYVLFNSAAVNAAYSYMARALMYFAEGIAVLDDLIFGFFYSGGEGLLKLSSIMRKGVNGETNVYLAAFVAGIIIIMLLIMV